MVHAGHPKMAHAGRPKMVHDEVDIQRWCMPDMPKSDRLPGGVICQGKFTDEGILVDGASSHDIVEGVIVRCRFLLPCHYRKACKQES